MSPKTQIDPAHPVGSLTAGDQQFTIVGDTHHGKTSIEKRVVDDIPEMARNGVKHIMIEYPAESLQSLEKKYPELADAKTWGERQKVLESYTDKLYDAKQAAGLKEAAGLDPEKDKKAWGEAYHRGAGRNEKETAVERRNLSDAQFDLQTHELLEKVYSKPPGITDSQIRRSSHDYISSMADDQRQSANNFAELLIQSRNAGIQVHFTGDHGDTALKVAEEQKREELDTYDRENKKYADYSKKMFADPNFKLPQEDTDGFLDYAKKAAQLNRDLAEIKTKNIAARDDPVKEQERVDRIIEAANGEKSVVVWGAAHAYKGNDFNEMLDARLKAQAEKAGTPTPAETKVIELYDSKADLHKDRFRTDEPDAKFFIKENELEIPPSGAKSLQLKAASAPVEQQYAELMGANVVGSVKSQSAPADPAEQTNRPVPVVAPTA